MSLQHKKNRILKRRAIFKQQPADFKRLENVFVLYRDVYYEYFFISQLVAPRVKLDDSEATLA